MTVDDNARDNGRDDFERELMAILVGDAGAALAHFQKGNISQEYRTDEQMRRRELVRSLHAAVDGVVWALRQHVRASARAMDLLTLDEESVLEEVSYQVNDRGTISAQARFLPFLGAVRLAVKIATKVSPGFSVDFEGKAWADFRDAVATRNRLTHPKTTVDLNVSSAEIDQVTASFFWILEVAVSAMEKSNHAFRRYVDEFSDIVQGIKAGDPAVLAEYRDALMSKDL